jgi:hypothetical protein
MVLGNLFRFYMNLPKDNIDDCRVTDEMHKSLERRWSVNADQPVFILATFFDPTIRGRPFNSDYLPAMKIFQLLEAQYNRFFDSALHDDTYDAFEQYYFNKGSFSDENFGLAQHIRVAQSKVSTLSSPHSLPHTLFPTLSSPHSLPPIPSLMFATSG